MSTNLPAAPQQESTDAPALGVAARLEGERAVIRALCEEMIAAGFHPVKVDDGGDECVQTTTTAEVLDAVFAVDESRIRFRNRAIARGGWVSIVLGNSPEEVIADHADIVGVFNEAIYKAEQRAVRS